MFGSKAPLNKIIAIADSAEKTGQKQLLEHLGIEVYVEPSGHKSFNAHWEIPCSVQADGLHSDDWRMLANLLAEFYNRAERQIEYWEKGR